MSSWKLTIPNQIPVFLFLNEIYIHMSQTPKLIHHRNFPTDFPSKMLVKVTSKSFTSSPPNSPCTAIFDPKVFHVIFLWSSPVISWRSYTVIPYPLRNKTNGVFKTAPPNKNGWWLEDELMCFSFFGSNWRPVRFFFQGQTWLLFVFRAKNLTSTGWVWIISNDHVDCLVWEWSTPGTPNNPFFNGCLVKQPFFE